MEVHGAWLMNLPFSSFLMVSPFSHTTRSVAMRRAGTTLLTKIALSMKPALFVARERPTLGRIYVIIKGFAIQTSTRKVMGPGDSSLVEVCI